MSKKIKLVLWIVAGVIAVWVGCNVYFSLKGYPMAYFKAKAEIEQYVNEKYGDKLQIGDIKYSTKMMGFIADVTETKDSRNNSFIEYTNSGVINDDYQFRVRERMSEEVSSMLYTLVHTGEGISKDDINIDVNIELPQYKYEMSDPYDPELPVFCEMQLKKGFATKESYGQAAFDTLNCIYKSGLKFDKIVIMSFLPEDGNKCYYSEILSKINNTYELINLTSVKSFEK